MTVIGVEIMFETEIEQLKKHLIARLPQAEPFVYLRDVLACESIADCYKKSIQAEVDWWIYEEQLDRADHAHFDTSAPELQNIFAELDNACRHFARFDSTQLLSVVDSAAKVRLNFLCRPRTTLKWFVFRGAPTKTVYEIMLRLAYFDDYSYLLNGFHEWAQKTYSKHPAMDLLSVVEFEKIMETIDNDFILDLSPHQFVDMLVPLFEFFHLGEEFTPQLTIPTEALIVFLDDKGVELIAHEIERLLYNNDMEHISQERFLDIVSDIINQIEEQESVPSKPSDSQVITDEIIDDTATITTETNEDIPQIIEHEIDTESNELNVEIPTEISEVQYDIPSEFLEIDHEVIAEFSKSQDENSINVEVELPSEIEEVEAFNFIETDQDIVTEIEDETPAVALIIEEEVIEQVIETDDEHTSFETEEFYNDTSTEISGKVAEPAEFIEIDYDILTEIEDEIPAVILVTDEQAIADITDVENEISTTSDEKAPQEIDGISLVENEINQPDIPNEVFYCQKETTEDNDGLTNQPEVEEEAEVILEELPVIETTVQEITHAIPSVIQYMDDRQRAEYIKKICSKDEQLFAQLVEEIDGSESWREAAQVIDKFFLKHKTDHRSAVAISFRTIVQKRYSGI